MLPFGVPLSAVFDPFLMLFFALLADAGLGELSLLYRRVPHPVVIIGRAIAWADRRLNRPQRGQGSRRVRGVLVVAVLCGAAWAIGAVLQKLAMEAPWGWMPELLLLVSLVAQRSLYDHVKAVADALSADGLVGGRAAVAMIVGRDPDQLDSAGVCRAAIESCAENFSDGVVAPVFWYVVAGLPGILVYKTVNTLDSMIGHRSETYRAFGWAAARLDDLLNLVPARLSGLLLVAAAVVVPGARPGPALLTMLRDARKHRSPNAGWPEAAMAGALGLKLAGPRRYPGYVVEDDWIGRGRAEATEADIRRSLTLLWAGCIANAGWIVALWLAQGVFA